MSRGLTARQTQVLKLFGEGLSGKEVAYRLGITPQAVSKYAKVFRRKLKLQHTAAIVRYGAELNGSEGQVQVDQLRRTPAWMMGAA